ncbi:hypothetical protein RKD47_001238 [Streptomyces albogriseolus]
MLQHPGPGGQRLGDAGLLLQPRDEQHHARLERGPGAEPVVQEGRGVDQGRDPLAEGLREPLPAAGAGQGDGVAPGDVPQQRLDPGPARFRRGRAVVHGHRLRGREACRVGEQRRRGHDQDVGVQAPQGVLHLDVGEPVETVVPPALDHLAGQRGEGGAGGRVRALPAYRPGLQGLDEEADGDPRTGRREPTPACLEDTDDLNLVPRRELRRVLEQRPFGVAHDIGLGQQECDLHLFLTRPRTRVRR